mmetsp:Transcript_78166/g.137979  ORF Transcript_78166/g.137979 Transcript_78166/m.137979 type:complete len:200 (-) Transcript_78166:830-1429(-)
MVVSELKEIILTIPDGPEDCNRGCQVLLVLFCERSPQVLLVDCEHGFGRPVHRHLSKCWRIILQVNLRPQVKPRGLPVADSQRLEVSQDVRPCNPEHPWLRMGAVGQLGPRSIRPHGARIAPLTHPLSSAPGVAQLQQPLPGTQTLGIQDAVAMANDQAQAFELLLESSPGVSAATPAAVLTRGGGAEGVALLDPVPEL